MRYSIFVIDDERVAREGVTLALKKHYQVASYPTAEAALEAMPADPPDLVLLDIGLPGMSGTEALVKIKERYPETVVVMITAFEDVKTVVTAMKRGAYDYVVKPLQMKALLVSVRNALESIALKKEIQLLQEKYLKENLPCFIGDSNGVQDVMDIVTKAAQSPDTPILILGETGTGKELIAQAIHHRSPNFKGSLVTVNCAAIPKELIESELFGYEKGAFSGADRSGKVGLVEKAIEGTLVLDEVADLSAEAQAKLLRFLETGEYYRVGGTQPRQVQTRVVSATNKDLSGLVEEDRFRRDLYHRLAVVKVRIPSLNERPEDIVPIARHFLVEFSQKFNKSFTGISPEVEAALRQFNWTGNVRELKNLIEKGVLLGIGPVLTPENLSLDEIGRDDDANERADEMSLPLLSPEGIDFPAIIETIENDYLNQALKLANDNESRAAKLLNLSRDKFRYRRQKLATPEE
jgi:DNA-binding NtrC family response regulator